MGGTPLVSLPELGGGNARVWAKLESFNPGGSAKDRTARALVADATARGLLHPGAVAVESSSGNLGIALAREAIAGGWEFHCVVDPRTNQATLAMIAALGAVLHPVEEPDPETGDWLTARRNLVGELKRELGAVNLDQYSNRAAFDAHDQGTMREIVQQLGHAPELLAVAVSTTGTVGGCLRHIREHGYSTKVVAVDAEGSVLFGGDRGERILPATARAWSLSFPRRWRPTGWCGCLQRTLCARRVDWHAPPDSCLGLPEAQSPRLSTG